MNEEKTTSVADRSQEFVAVEGSAETSSAANLLVAAYIIMWLIVFAFVWKSHRRLLGLQSRIDELDSAVKRADGKAAS